ncbi:HPP family membrane protein [Aliarcobacter faecis]|uniref:HPP family protein n=1 Tax=Aliarcobacter faecis TaxID=1564138 RepID=UPI00047D97A7|nr:HPP family protein [Aliarcobacter faecis]QKF72970.1 HPP family membrane protein [Aliarcobacter faecis]
MNNYLKKFAGQNEKSAPIPSLKKIFFAFIGGFIAIATLGYLTKTYDNLLIMGSFGASCVLLFGFPKSPFSQPRNIIFGHFISSLIGLFFLHFIGDNYISMALALASAIALMMVTKTVHPPAGSNPLIIFLLGASWDYLIFPTLVGTVILVLIGLFYNNLDKNRNYPQYWF